MGCHYRGRKSTRDLAVHFEVTRKTHIRRGDKRPKAGYLTVKGSLSIEGSFHIRQGNATLGRSKGHFGMDVKTFQLQGIKRLLRHIEADIEHALLALHSQIAREPNVKGIHSSTGNEDFFQVKLEVSKRSIGSTCKICQNIHNSGGQ